MRLKDQLITVADTYCEARKHSRAYVSTLVLNAGHRLDTLADDRGDLVTGNFEKAMLWFSANWPDGAAWPAEIPRPPVSLKAEDAA